MATEENRSDRSTGEDGQSTDDILRDTILNDTAIRPLDNSKAVLADINREQLSNREISRLNTIQKKIDELRNIRAENIKQGYNNGE
jgi:hypothetical protein